MKSLLLVILIGIVAFLAYQYRTKDLAMRAIVEQQAQAEATAETAKKVEQLKNEARTAKEQARTAMTNLEAAKNELGAAKQEIETTIAERDDARRQVEAANTEIARLTATTPKPVSWFEQRLQNNAGRLDAPAKTSPGVRPRYNPYAPYAEPAR